MPSSAREHALRRLRNVGGRAIDARNRARGRRAARAFYAGFIHEGCLCFDIGANIGERTRAFLSLGARVVAVEPQARCVARLMQIRSDALTVEPVALGAAPGVGTMHLATASTISSMSPGWIRQVEESGRFSGEQWSDETAVDLTTLDALITKHGLPGFCKIDVEGYEEEVIGGLSEPLPLVSLEFTPEYAQSAFSVIHRLVDLGTKEFNFSEGESFSFAWPDWRSAMELRLFLEELPQDGRLFGDIYARL